MEELANAKTTRDSMSATVARVVVANTAERRNINMCFMENIADI